MSIQWRFSIFLNLILIIIESRKSLNLWYLNYIVLFILNLCDSMKTTSWNVWRRFVDSKLCPFFLSRFISRFSNVFEATRKTNFTSARSMIFRFCRVYTQMSKTIFSVESYLPIHVRHTSVRVFHSSKSWRGVCFELIRQRFWLTYIGYG